MENAPEAPIASLEMPEVSRCWYYRPDRSADHHRAPLTLSPTEVDAFSVHSSTGRFAHDRSMLRQCTCRGDEVDAFYDLNAANPPISRSNTASATTTATDARVGSRVVSDRRPPMENFLRCISEKAELLEQLPEVVCMRSTLRRIMCAPYQYRFYGKNYAEGWKIAFRKVANSWYLCEIWSQQVRYPYIDQLKFWGSQFEQCLTAPGSSSVSRGRGLGRRPDGAFYSIASARLGDHSLLYAGEIDFCRSRSDGGVGGGVDPSEGYVEVKTNQLCVSQTQEKIFARRKLLQWWAQSYLMGIPTIICGFRDNFGVVSQVKEYSTSDLPRLADERDAQWDPALCLHFLDQVLRHVKNTATSDECVYVMEFQPTSKIIPTRVFKINECPFPMFPPQWFCEIVSLT